LEAELVQRAFAKIERECTVKEFRGVVYTPMQPPFKDFQTDAGG
jgi:hypothetical protein